MIAGGYVVLDTDVASLSLKSRLPARAQTVLVGRTMVTTFVTVGEMTKWAKLQGWGQRRRAELSSWLHELITLPYDPSVAVTWGDLQAEAQLRGRSRPVNDSWIAACCLVYDMPLATFNTKDFVDYAEHEGLRLVEL